MSYQTPPPSSPQNVPDSGNSVVGFKCRQVDKYDGQFIYAGNKAVYELGNYLGGGASGSVYQAQTALNENSREGNFSARKSSNTEKSVAIKILNPLGYKNIVTGQINRCQIAVKGRPLTAEQMQGRALLKIDNVWWLIHPNSKILFAAYEDPHRVQLRELPLPKCVEIWGMNPFDVEHSNESEIEKLNVSDMSVNIDGNQIRIPIVSPKYLAFLRNRKSVSREMCNMVRIGEHPNIIELMEVLELIQDTKTTLFLVLELVNGGELFDRMKAGCVTGNTEPFARRYFNQLMSGIEYCHKKGVVHRDLKPENLLLSDPSDSAILKIADFGLSAVVFAAESSSSSSSATSSSQDNGVMEASAAGGSTGDVSRRPVFLPPNQIQQTHVNSGRANLFHATSPFMKSSDYYHQRDHLATIASPLSSPSTASITTRSISSTAMSTPPPIGLSHSSGAVPPISVPLAVRRLTSVVGSPHYIAPEIAYNDPSGYDGRKVDMWSAGVILYSLLTGALPFGGDIISCSRFKRYKQWLFTEYVTDLREGREPTLPQWFWPPHLSPLAGSLLVGLLHWDPAMRLTAESVMQHPWCLGISYDEYKQLLLQQMLHDELLLDGGDINRDIVCCEPVEVKKDLFAAGPSSRRDADFDLSSGLAQSLADRLEGLAISSGINSSRSGNSGHVASAVVPTTTTNPTAAISPAIVLSRGDSGSSVSSSPSSPLLPLPPTPTPPPLSTALTHTSKLPLANSHLTHSQSQQRQQQQTPFHNHHQLQQQQQQQQQQAYSRSIALGNPSSLNQPSQVAPAPTQQQTQVQRVRAQAPPSLYDQHLQRMQKEAAALQQETTQHYSMVDNDIYSNGGTTINNSRMEVSVISRVTRTPAPQGGIFSTSAAMNASVIHGATSSSSGGGTAAAATTVSSSGDNATTAAIASYRDNDNDNDLPLAILPSSSGNVDSNNLNNFR